MLNAILVVVIIIMLVVLYKRNYKCSDCSCSHEHFQHDSGAAFGESAGNRGITSLAYASEYQKMIYPM